MVWSEGTSIRVSGVGVGRGAVGTNFSSKSPVIVTVVMTRSFTPHQKLHSLPEYCFSPPSRLQTLTVQMLKYFGFKGLRAHVESVKRCSTKVCWAFYGSQVDFQLDSVSHLHAPGRSSHTLLTSLTLSHSSTQLTPVTADQRILFEGPTVLKKNWPYKFGGAKNFGATKFYAEAFSEK